MVHIPCGDYYTVREVSVMTGILEVTIRQFINRNSLIVPGVIKVGHSVLLTRDAIKYLQCFICPRS